MDKDDKKQEEPWSWETDILASYPSGVDWSQIEERLKLTPTERLERMRQDLIKMEKLQGGSKSE